jgi:hypothetical protein
MSVARLEDVVARVELLEREKRQVCWLLGIVGVVVVALLAGTGFVRNGRKLEAEQVVLRDRAGQVRAQLAVAEDGTPELVMLDNQGRRQVAVHGSAHTAGGLELYDHGQVRMSLWSGEDGAAGLNLYDRSSRSASTMYMLQDGTTGLGFGNRELGMELATQPGGIAGFVVADGTGKEHARWGALPESVRYRKFYRGGGQAPFETLGGSVPTSSSAITAPPALPATVPRSGPGPH